MSENETSNMVRVIMPSFTKPHVVPDPYSKKVRDQAK